MDVRLSSRMHRLSKTPVQSESYKNPPCILRRILAHGRLTKRNGAGASGCSSGVEHNLAKVGVVGSNPIARSKFLRICYDVTAVLRGRFSFLEQRWFEVAERASEAHG